MNRRARKDLKERIYGITRDNAMALEIVTLIEVYSTDLRAELFLAKKKLEKLNKQ